jgi:hypothetical protein
MNRPVQPAYGTARDINPEAGVHAVSRDPVENAATAMATRKSWKDFPYYPRRYGERGWSFSLSDSSWLTTLCDSSPEDARTQVNWLGGLLSARGMPQYLLERHLEHLHSTLMTAMPDRGAKYEALTRCAGALREIREAQIPEPVFKRLAEEFDERVKACKDRVPNMGAVLVAAVADERAGHANAVASVESWACDPARFSETWIAAVKETITAAREATTGART